MCYAYVKTDLFSLYLLLEKEQKSRNKRKKEYKPIAVYHDKIITREQKIFPQALIG